MVVPDLLRDLEQEMEKTAATFRKDLARVRTGRASSALLDGILVDYYGASTPLNRLASVTTPGPRLLVVQPFDLSVIAQIEKVIRTSDLGLNPSNDGKVIRVPIPELTQERRKDLVKRVRKLAEEFRVSIRNHRRDCLEMIKEMENEKEITEDDHKKAVEKIQKITTSYIEKIEKILHAKEEEILQV
jgi:ribosome recycling factor